MADPTRIAKVMQQLLRCGAALAAPEVARNTFRPAEVLVAAPEAVGAGATAAAVAQGGGGGGADAAAGWSEAVWRLLVAAPALRPAVSAAAPIGAAPQPLVPAPIPLVAATAPAAAPLVLPPVPLVAAPLVSVGCGGGAVAAVAAAAAAAPTGALGAILGRRQGRVELRYLTLDIAGLKPPPHEASLVPGGCCWLQLWWSQALSVFGSAFMVTLEFTRIGPLIPLKSSAPTLHQAPSPPS